MLTGKHILAIDDALSIRTFLRISLESHNVKFDEAGTATEGLTLCLKHAPDLVVLDLGLPDRDGLEILPEIKNPANYKDGAKVPRVIVLTVRKENEIKDKARQLGADAYITKPFMVDELLEAISVTVLGQVYTND